MIGDSAFLEAGARAAAQALLNGLAQGVLLTAAVAATLHLLRGTNAATRHAVWCATLLVVVALPVAAAVRMHEGGAAPLPSAAPGSWVEPSEPPVLTRTEVIPAADAHARASASARWSIEVPPGAWLLLLLGGGLLVGAARTGRLLWALCALRRLKRASQPLPAASQAELASLCAVHVRRQVGLRLSERITTPVTLGFIHPVILLPATLLEQLGPQERAQILLHELAHVRRRDDWTNLAQRLVEAVLFFHPAVWWIGRRLDLERELACDDYVVASLAGERAYARCLTRLAELVVASRSEALAPGAVARTGQLAHRVRALLSPARPPNARLTLGGASLLVVLVSATGAALVQKAPVLALSGLASDAGLGAASAARAPAAAGAPSLPRLAAEPPPEIAATPEASAPSSSAVRPSSSPLPRLREPAPDKARASEVPVPQPRLAMAPGPAEVRPLARSDTGPTAAPLPDQPGPGDSPADALRERRRGVSLEVTLALPYGSAIESSRRIFSGPASLGLPSLAPDGAQGMGGLRERVLPGRSGIRLRVIGGNAPPAPLAPLGRW